MIKHKIQIVTDKARQAQIFDSYEAAAGAGYKQQPIAPDAERARHILRAELRDKPPIAGLCGPMWGGYRDANGEGIYFAGSGDNPSGEIASYSPSHGPIDHYLVRYEDWESYDLLSR